MFPGFSTTQMDEVFADASRVAAMVAVEAAVAAAQGDAGVIPPTAATAIVAACARPVPAQILADGWQSGTPVLGMLDVLRSRLTEGARPFLHHALTTQDVVDTATVILVRDAVEHLGELATHAAGALKALIATYGEIATFARSFLQPADVTTFGFRAARWLEQLDHARRDAASAELPLQLGGLIGDAMGIDDRVVTGVAERLGLRSRRSWHTDRSPMVALVGAATGFARWADKVAGDIAQLSQLGEITTRAGGSSAAAGKRNPIDAMRAMAAAEVCLGTSTVVTNAKPHELERGLGAWHAEWCAVPIVFQTAGAAMEAVGAALSTMTVEPSALVVAEDRRAAAATYVASVLQECP
jgi:3-carboxy-cis,cis-muconate cycloisomerase